MKTGLRRFWQKRKLIVPLVGDFAGPKTLKAIAGYLKQHNAAVLVFNISNVVYYIQQESAKWVSCQSSLATLPVRSQAMRQDIKGSIRRCTSEKPRFGSVVF
jgi:hypothetical protein